MNHNEVKSFFKKNLAQSISDKYELLSIDVTKSKKNLFIVDKKTFKPKLILQCYFAVNDFSVNVYKPKKKINYLVDMLYGEEAEYTELDLLNKLIKKVVKEIK